MLRFFLVFSLLVCGCINFLIKNKERIYCMLHFWADCCVQHVARPSGPRLIYRCSGCTKKMLINMFIMRQQKNSLSFFSSHSTIEIHNLIWTQSSSLSALLCVSFQRVRERERGWGSEGDRTAMRVLSLSLSHLNGAHCEYFRGILMKFICVRAQNYPSDQSFWARPPFPLLTTLSTCLCLWLWLCLGLCLRALQMRCLN